MSNVIVVPQSFNGQVAPVFAGQQANDDLSGGITGGYAVMSYKGKVWSIRHNGNTQVLMRDDNDGPRGSIDVVIVKANGVLSKTWYENGWDENNNNPPDCASANGITPDAGVPKQQSPVCATCVRNAWGSAPGGGKGKACGDHRRMAVVPLPPQGAPNAAEVLRNESLGGPILLRCPAASLQDMAAFDSRMKQIGYPYFTIGIKISFDPAESYPKFQFQAIRPLDNAEGEIVMQLRDAAETARVISEGTAPAPAPQVAAPAQGVFLEQLAPGTQPAAAAQPAAQPQQVQVQPAPAQPAPAPAQPAAAATGPVGGFGRAAPVTASGGNGGGQQLAQPAAQPAPQPATQPAPAAQPAQQAQVAPQPQQRAATAMTGFGAVAPAPAAQPVQEPVQTAAPVVAQPATQPVEAAPVTPGVVSAFEGSIDDRLNALLAQ